MAHVFLSYSQADNFFPKEWVQNFHKSLQEITIATAGIRDFEIWRDIESRKGNDLDQEIKDELGKANFLLVLVSPLYFEDKSGWCTREREHFVHKVVQDISLAKRRIITALKSFDEKEDEIQLPEELKSQFRYKLYKLNKNNIPRPLEPTDPDWEDCLLSIAYSIKLELKNSQEKATAKNQRSIFLASSKELYDEQLKLSAELVTAGIKVKTLLPNLTNIDNWKKEFDENISTSQLSIHLLSQNYDIKPAINCSIEEKQWLWAIEHAADSEKRVLSWIPQGLTNVDTRQQQFVNSIKNNDHLPQGHDFLEKTFEEFVGSVKDYLKL
jgi:hypothetical protein